MTGLTSHWYLILIVLIIVLIIWGPGKLPDVGAGLGRAINEFRRTSSETRDSLMNNPADHRTAGPHASPSQPPASPPPVHMPPAPPPAPPQQPDAAPPPTSSPG